jgi:hypothetical protein
MRESTSYQLDYIINLLVTSCQTYLRARCTQGTVELLLCQLDMVQ